MDYSQLKQAFVWKVTTTKRKCLFKVRDLLPGEIFGQDELLTHFENILRTVQSNGNPKQVRMPKR